MTFRDPPETARHGADYRPPADYDDELDDADSEGEALATEHHMRHWREMDERQRA